VDIGSQKYDIHQILRRPLAEQGLGLIYNSQHDIPEDPQQLFQVLIMRNGRINAVLFAGFRLMEQTLSRVI